MNSCYVKKMLTSFMTDAGGCATLHTDFTDDNVDSLCGALLETDKK
jgi:hypothetical protein